MLARHWRTQLLYKVKKKNPIFCDETFINENDCIFSQQVELKSSSKRMGTVLENDSFQC